MCFEGTSKVRMDLSRKPTRLPVAQLGKPLQIRRETTQAQLLEKPKSKAMER